MPVNIQRLNAKTTYPNERIIFIKPLPGPSSATAEDFLSRIAAQCVPVMRAHHLSVMTLEEHEPNREFVGRNFNAGEIIQLVLRAPGSGRWLPFHYVQMVMMHELAHCVQMNHSKAFWAKRNEYAQEMRALWAKSYRGEGLWGRGQSLYDGQYDVDAMPAPENLPEHLCGGTYRSRGRKRKRGGEKPKLSYAERKQRRIEKKFGVNGASLGADEETRILLERGNASGRPRVAKSKRGRELRAAAALLRFEQNKNAQEQEPSEDNTGSDESETEEEDMAMEDARAADGSRMKDAKGRAVVRVCGDTQNDVDARQELKELGMFNGEQPTPAAGDDPRLEEQDDDDGETTEEEEHPADTAPTEFSRPSRTQSDSKHGKDTAPTGPTLSATNLEPPDTEPARSPEKTAQECPICGLHNSLDQLTCAACAHVLDTRALPRYWICASEACKGSAYVNAEDAGVCGVCGAPKSA